MKSYIAICEIDKSLCNNFYNNGLPRIALTRSERCNPMRWDGGIWKTGRSQPSPFPSLDFLGTRTELSELVGDNCTVKILPISY